MIVAYLPLLVTTLCHVEDPVDLEYQQKSMQSHLQAPQGNWNEDLFPSKTTRKRQKNHNCRQLIAVFMYVLLMVS